MHGLIFAGLKKYVGSKFDAKTWEVLLEKSGLKGNMYVAASVYPDRDILSLVNTACELTGLSANAILEDFGEFIAADLIAQYSFLVKQEWTFLDFLCNTEETIHKVMRFHQGVTPPRLVVTRIAEDKVIISYDSTRRMCALLKGIVKGAARHYREEVNMMESSCMLQGDSGMHGDCGIGNGPAAWRCIDEPESRLAVKLSREIFFTVRKALIETRIPAGAAYKTKYKPGPFNGPGFMFHPRMDLPAHALRLWRERIQLAGSELLLKGRRQVLHPAVIDHGDGQHALSAHSVKAHDLVIDRGARLGLQQDPAQTLACVRSPLPSGSGSTTASVLENWLLT